MSIVTFCSTHRHSIGMFAENMADRLRLRAVVELRGTGMRIDIIDLLRFELSIGQRVAHCPNARFAGRQRRSHMERVVVQAVAENFGVNTRAARTGMFRSEER